VDVTGTVYLVGAGPGDPDLLTVRARQLIEVADALVYDALVHPSVVAGAGTAERIYVGKRAGQHSHSQEEINRLLVEVAGRCGTVVRLKGGDPFVFGRGGEEAIALADAGVPFEIVPGVTAGIAAPAYAGIPVTHRGVATHVTFATGHEDPGKDGSGMDWELLARSGTAVFYMGIGKLEENLARLEGAGRDPGTPAAAIEWGTYPRQRTVTGTVRTLPAVVADAGIRPPAVVVVGDVVRLRDRLRWFEERPLFGIRVLVTRARAQASSFVDRLRDLGADPVEFPTIRIAPPSDGGAALAAAARNAGRYDWIVFTSVNGVSRFWKALEAGGMDTRALAGARVCAIGPATSGELARRGVAADLVPERFVAESVIAALEEAGEVPGSRILLPRAQEARDVLPRALAERGAEVSDVPAYRTEPDGEGSDRIRDRLREGTLDVITFTASSTVRNFVDLVGTDIGDAVVASIGPITSRTAREAGLPVHLEADRYDIPGLIEALMAWRRQG
jgi:uroporphyrinogen III methyltransferase / synthase